MSAPYYRFDGSNDIITVGDEAVMDDIFGSGGGSIRALIYPNSDGEDSSGNIVGKYGTGNAGWWVSTNDESGGFVAIRLYRYWSSTDLNATTSVLVPINAWSEIVVTYDDSSGSNDPIFYLNGAVLASSDAGDASGSAQSDDGEDLLIGGNEAGTRNFDGQISGIQAWNKILTATEVKELYSGASVPFKYKGANQTAMITGNNADFSGAGNWAGASATVTQNYDSGDAGHDSCMRIEATATQWSRSNLPIANWDVAPTEGKTYRITFDYKWVNYDSIPAGQGYIYFGSNSSAATNSFDGNWNSTEAIMVYEAGSYGIACYANSAAGTTDNEILIDNLTITQIGAVAEYDGSTAGAHQWGDKSGNELHGTVGDGAGGATAPTLENTPYDAGTEYEEGTWTPVYAPASGAFSALTMEVFTASYIKIGNKVTVEAGIRTDDALTIDTGSGDLLISGLPFNGAGSIVIATSMRFASGKYPTGGQVENSYIILTERAAITGTTNECGVDTLSTSGDANQNQISFSATYIAS
jgi:hypothetical protein